jgi:hypothetical protein
MILYHGSNMSFSMIDLDKGLPAKDFGRGFYATDSLECAEKTARQRVARLGGSPKIMVFELNESLIQTMNVRSFAEPCKEWALFVRANRKTDGEAEDHNRDNRYDIVCGPIANDKLSLLFRLYERDIITVDEFAKRMQFKELYTQYSFHTERALTALQFKEVQDVN